MLNDLWSDSIQSQSEEFRGDELSDINLRLQDQLNQEKTDMQMKSEELNILIRLVTITILAVDHSLAILD